MEQVRHLSTDPWTKATDLISRKLSNTNISPTPRIEGSSALTYPFSLPPLLSFFSARRQVLFIRLAVTYTDARKSLNFVGNHAPLDPQRPHPSPPFSPPSSLHDFRRLLHLPLPSFLPWKIRCLVQPRPDRKREEEREKGRDQRPISRRK